MPIARLHNCSMGVGEVDRHRHLRPGGTREALLQYVQGTQFRVGASQGSEAADRKRPSSSPAADSSCSNGLKRARTTSSALLDLLPLASDASTLDSRCVQQSRVSLA